MITTQSLVTLAAQSLVPLGPTRSSKRTRFGIPDPPPRTSEMVATGFDAIIQVDDRVMLDAVHRATGGRAEVSHDVDGLDLSVRRAIDDIVAAADLRAPLFGWPFATGDVAVQLAATRVDVELRVRRVSPSHGRDPSCTFFLAVQVHVVADETPASYAARVDRASFDRAPPPFRGQVPVDAVPEQVRLELASATVELTVPLAAEVMSSRLPS